MNKFNRLLLLAPIGSLVMTQISCSSNSANSVDNSPYHVVWTYDHNKCQHTHPDQITINDNQDYVDKITYKPGYVFDHIKLIFGTGNDVTTYTESYSTDKSQLKWMSSDFSTLTIPKDKIKFGFCKNTCKSKLSISFSNSLEILNPIGEESIFLIKYLYIDNILLL